MARCGDSEKHELNKLSNLLTSFTSTSGEFCQYQLITLRAKRGTGIARKGTGSQGLTVKKTICTFSVLKVETLFAHCRYFSTEILNVSKYVGFISLLLATQYFEPNV